MRDDSSEHLCVMVIGKHNIVAIKRSNCASHEGRVVVLTAQCHRVLHKYCMPFKWQIGLLNVQQ